MSLAYSETTDYLVSSSRAFSDDNATVIAWIYPTQVTDSRYVFRWFGGTEYLNLNQAGSQEFYLETVDPSGWTYRATNNNYLTVNAWNFIAGTYDGTDVKLYHGTPSSPPALCTMGSQSGGGGVIQSFTADLYIGNQSSNNSGRFEGRIAMIHYIGRALSLGEIIQQWVRALPVSSSRVLYHLGLHGTGSVPDLSGNGYHATTINGLTLADQPPLGPIFGFDTPQPYTPSGVGPTGIMTPNTFYWGQH